MALTLLVGLVAISVHMYVNQVAFTLRKGNLSRLYPAQYPTHLREREKLYIFSSHLGLIRCLTPVRVSAIIYFQAFLDKHRNTTNIILPHKLNHGSRMLSKEP